MAVHVKFWGVRGSIPTPGWRYRKYGGNTPCVELRFDDVVCICDGGTGIRELGEQLQMAGPASVVTHLLFSHPHWDHIQGFPFFAPGYQQGNALYVWGTEEGDTRYFDLLSGQMHSDYFPVEFSELGANIEPRFLATEGQIEGVKVSWLEQHHPGGSLAYCFEFEGRKVVYATDNELDQQIVNSDETASDPDLIRTVAADYLDFIAGADLLIADGQYEDSEYLKRIGWGHPRATTVTDAAVTAEVKQLAIFHHDPMHGDEIVDRMLIRCQERAQRAGSRMVVFGAREGVELLIEPS